MRQKLSTPSFMVIWSLAMPTSKPGPTSDELVTNSFFPVSCEDHAADNFQSRVRVCKDNIMDN